jgi:hypothetical protein
MKAFIANLLLWRLAIIRITLFSFVAGATTFVTTMSGLEWSALTGTQKFVTVLGCVVAMSNNIIAFLDRTISRISDGQPPVGGEDEKIKLG